MWILLFSGVTLFEYNCLSNFVGNCRLLHQRVGSLALLFSSTTNRSLPFKAHACTGEISRGRFQAISLARGKIPLKKHLFSR